MTPEERTRMDELCASIQEEKDYEKFAAMLHEMSELIGRKEQRRFPQQPKIVWARNKPWVSMLAIVTKTLPTVDIPTGKVEVFISAGDELFREIRIQNQFTGVFGNSVTLSVGARLQLTLEAEPADTAPDSHT